MNEITDRVKALTEICARTSWTVGLAESCTGGLLASWISAEPGVSAFFQGGVVSYARAVKQNSLGVPSALISAHGQVSLPVALSMARGAKRELEADWGLSITGVAGPSGGTPEKPVGYVCFAVSGPAFERAIQRQFDARGGRQDIQRQAALFAFDFLLNAM